MMSIENRAFPTIACSLALLAGNTYGFKVIYILKKKPLKKSD